MRFLTVINFLYSSVFQRCYQGLKPRGKRRRGKYYTHFWTPSGWWTTTVLANVLISYVRLRTSYGLQAPSLAWETITDIDVSSREGALGMGIGGRIRGKHQHPVSSCFITGVVFLYGTSCAGGRQNIPRPCKLTFDLLTLKVVFESRVTWATSAPTLVFLGLSVLDLCPMYATDRPQTSDAHHRLMPPTLGAGV